MFNLKTAQKFSGWFVFAIAFVVYFLTAERTGSLWDCGEFILAAYKLQVVHPPGAPLFLMVGRLFTIIAEVFSDNPSDIAYAVNMMSGTCTAFAAAFVAWVTFMLSKLALVGREGAPDQGQLFAITGASVVAGLTTAFCSSIWFSAVEGEVYAMSTFFTTLTLWSTVKWYNLPEDSDNDRWLVFTIFAAAMSIGVHLLSLLTFPALALFYYFKKFKKINVKGAIVAMGIGVLAIIVIQKLIIVGIPQLWAFFDRIFVNSFGLPPNSGIIPTLLLVGGLVFLGLRYSEQKRNHNLQLLFVVFALSVIGFSTIGEVVVRANAHPPVNMSAPTDPFRLIPYLNREQYGERPLLYGPHFGASYEGFEQKERYGLKDGRYQVVDYKTELKYNSNDMMLFPRMSHNDASRKRLYQNWMGKKKNKPTFFENIGFFLDYQVGYMYWRYFMWNFSGRQNGLQGTMVDNPKKGNAYTGITFIDEMFLHNESKLPDSMANDQARNRYYMIPLIMGILGLIFHYRRRRREFLAMLALFAITGLGIIVYSNQPPQEPRERDYVLIGSFFTYAIWVGMGALAIFSFLAKKISLNKMALAGLGTAVALIAPLLMVTENWDDHSRRHHTGARDYAANFLNSLEDNAILFTYGDNDTYPLWYAQEVEGIRTDVRVINLSLIAVDWYINHQRHRLNESPPVKFSISEDGYRGYKRNQVVIDPNPRFNRMSLKDAMKYVNEDHRVTLGGQRFDYSLPTKNLFIPVNANQAVQSGWVSEELADQVGNIQINFPENKRSITKDDLAVLDIIASNIEDRPIYFALTVQPSKLQRLQDYMQVEGLAMRVVPVRTKSDRSLSIFGSGRIAEDKVYNNIMNEFKWGNFDKRRLYVDRSYGATQQAHRLVMMRAAGTFLNNGENQKAADMAKKYFEAFPHMNFPYDAGVTEFIRVLIRAGDMEEAKKHLDILANEMEQKMEFYASLDEAVIRRGFRQDMQFDRRATADAIDLARQVGDQAFAQRVRDQLSIYIQPVKN